MSDITDQVVETPAGTAYYPQDASIDKLNILTSSGQTVDVKKLLVEMSYYEDIYSFVVSGYVMLRDAVGLIEKLQLTGKEFIEINFGKVSNSSSDDDKTFRLYGVPKRTPEGNLNSEVIKLYFCSEELLLSQQVKITKSYNGVEVYNIINDILLNQLKVPASRVRNIDPTVGKYDFNIPANIKPLEAISWLSTYARPTTNSLVGADMLFYETVDGFNFKSLSTLYQQTPYQTYSYQQKNLNTATFQQDVTTVLDYEFVKSYNSLQEAISGAFESKLISLDPMNRTKKTTYFDYSSYHQKNSTTINGTSALSSAPNRLNLTQNQAYDGVTKMAIGNSGQKLKPYYQQGINSVAEDIYLENSIPTRTAQLALLSQTVLKIRIPGDPDIRVGYTINFNFGTLMDSTGQKSLDKYYSGKYVVTAARHILQSSGIYQTILEISKDSPATGYASITSSSPAATSFAQAYAD